MTTVRETFGLACPGCGSNEDLIVEVTTCVRLHPDGTEDIGDQEWTGLSYCACRICDRSGTVTEFHIPDTEGGQ